MRKALLLKGSQLAKIKKYIPYLSLPWIEAVGLLNLENYDFHEYVKFGPILWKCHILSITAWLKLKSKNPFAHMWYILLWISAAHNISFLLNQFSVKYGFPFPICVFYRKTPSVTQWSVSRESAFKKSRNPSAFVRKTISSNNSFTLIKNDLWFLRYRRLNSR